MKTFILIPTAFLLLITSCGPVNRFTRAKKVPREYSLNYCGGEIKAPKTDLNKEPWIVFSDRENNRTFSRAGGKVQAGNAAYLDPFLVIKQKGDFLCLVKYTPGILKNGKLEYRKAEYSGWMHKSRLLLNRQSVTDITSGKKNRMLLVFSDTTALHEPEKYFISDSVKLFRDPELKASAGKASPYSIVYPLKMSDDGKKTLVSKKTALDVDEAKAGVLGWVDNSLIKDIGTGLHVNLTGLPKDSLYFFEKNGQPVHLTEDMQEAFSHLSEQYKTIQYSPVSSYSVQGSRSAFRTRILMPLFDLSGNYIFNVNGEQIPYKSYRTITREMKKINISFVFEGREETVARFPQLINALQNMQDLFEPDGVFSLSFNSVMSFGAVPDSVVYTTFSPDYASLVNFLSSMTENNVRPQPLQERRQWPALHKALELQDSHRDAANLIILIGETGYATPGVDTAILRRLTENNCRIAAFQVYADKGDAYNNFVLDAAQMITASSGDRLQTKREMLVTPGQIRKENVFIESPDQAKNTFRLDFPDRSINQGILYFPPKSEEIPMEILAENLDTILSQIKQDSRDVIRQMEQSFNVSGKNHTCFDSLFVRNFELKTALPSKKLLASFNNEAPGWYLPSGTFIIDDWTNDTVDFHLMLSEQEMNELKEFIKSLSALEVDLKYRSGKKEGKQKQVCNCPEDELFTRPENKRETWNPFIPPEYENTRKVRKNIYRQYTQSIQYCKLCREKNSQLQSMNLSEAQRRITGSPSSNRGLASFLLSDIKDREKLPDEMLDRLINYFKEKAGELEKAEAFQSNGETYYWVKRELLP
jgi:hypothetical protein